MYRFIFFFLFFHLTDRATIMIKYYQVSCHTRTHSTVAIYRPGAGRFFCWVFSLFPPGCHHLFLERAILLNWHPNIWSGDLCPILSSVEADTLQEGLFCSFFFKAASLAAEPLLRVTSWRAVVERRLRARVLGSAHEKTVTAHDSLATNWTVTPRQRWQI